MLVDHLGEGGLLEIGRALHDLHQVLGLVGPQLVCVLHISPLLGHAFVQAGDGALEADGPKEDEGDEAADDEQRDERTFHAGIRGLVGQRCAAR